MGEDKPAGRGAASTRAANAAEVLAELRRRGEAARVDLCDSLGLSPATVSAAVSALLDQGLVRETRSLVTPGRGRPRVQLTLNPEARYVAGAKVAPGALTVAILNFTGDVLADIRTPLAAAPVQAEALLTALDRGLMAALTQAGLKQEQIAAFGLGAPGFIERETGRCHWSPLIATASSGPPTDLRALLKRRFDCPAHVDNDANLATLAELWFGHGRAERDFLVVTIGHGVGLGVVMGGRLYRGARGLGAEFGHTKMQIDGALCRCGQRGCLDAYVADFALEREARTALQDPHQASGALLDLLAQRAAAGDPGPAAIYRQAGRVLGLGLANLINLFDPATIVLTGESIRNHALLKTGLEDALQENTIVTARPKVPLLIHRWGDSLWARGAGALALEALAEEGLPASA